MLKKKTAAAVALAASALASGSLVTSASATEELGQCHGVNSCKGQSAGATAESNCAGQNACEGKGWIKTTDKDCKAKGGKFLPLDKEDNS